MCKFNLALIPLSQGKYEGALKILDQGLAEDEHDEQYLQQVEKHEILARIYSEKKEFDKALQHSQRIVELLTQLYPDVLYTAKASNGNLHAQAGRIQEAKNIADEVKDMVKNKTEDIC